MAKALEDMTDQETMLFSLYADLEYALVQEYEIMTGPDTISEHLKETVGSWSERLYEMGLLDEFHYKNAQSMAEGSY